MANSIVSEGRGKKKRWRVRYTDPDTGAQKSSVRFKSPREAEDEKAVLSVRLSIAAGAPRLALMPWREVRERWIKHRTGAVTAAYLKQAREVFARHTNDWKTTRDATPLAMAELPIVASRTIKAVLRWAGLFHDQPVDIRSLAVRPKRVRPKKRKAPILDALEVDALVRQCMAASPGNGLLAHLVATYGHRAENLVHLLPSAFAGGRLVFKVKSGEIIDHRLAAGTMGLLLPLLDHADGAQPLMQSHLGRAWTSGEHWSWWFYQKFGLGYYRALKGWAVTRLLAFGHGARTVASVTGHETPSVLQNNYDGTNARMQDAVIKSLEESALPGLFPVV